jgi:hypothetical protein
MVDELRRKPTIFGAMVLVAAIERVRLALAAYSLIVFVILGVLSVLRGLT